MDYSLSNLPLFNTTLGYGSTTTGDAVTTLANQVPQAGFFDSGGAFSKIIDTVGQVYLTKAQIEAANRPTTQQVDAPTPGAPVNTTSSASMALSKVVPYIPYIVGGAFLFIGVIVAVRLARK